MTLSQCLEDFQAAAAQDLSTLAVLHHAELDDELLARLRQVDFPQSMGLRLTTEDGREAIDLLTKAIQSLSSPLSSIERDELAADYAAIYLTYAYRASPCESVWLDQENLGMQAPMFQVREIYRRYQLAAPNWRLRPDDHLVLELHFLAHMMQEDHPEALAEAARFLDEHLLRWLPQFARRVSHRCATAFYAGRHGSQPPIATSYATCWPLCWVCPDPARQRSRHACNPAQPHARPYSPMCRGRRRPGEDTLTRLDRGHETVVGLGLCTSHLLRFINQRRRTMQPAIPIVIAALFGTA